MDTIFQNIQNGRLGLVLMQLGDRIKACMDASLQGKYEALCEEYHYLLKFFLDGIDDPQREKMLEGMKKRAYHLASDVSMLEKFRSEPTIASFLKQHPTDGYSTMTLLEQFRQTASDVKEHYKILNDAFISICFSLTWKEQDSRMWTAFLIDESVPSVDAQTIVAAITLSCLNGFCMEKYRTLAYVYLASNDKQVRHRALIGSLISNFHASSYPFEEDIKAVLEDLLAEDGTEQSLLEIIMQIIRCNEAEADNKKLHDEIMPDIIKSNKIQLGQNGIIEKDEDTLDDILNPGKSEAEMEKMESRLAEVRKLQNSGADLFYSGFSMMKRYPFFYKLSNWFTPFTTEHPDLTGLNYGNNRQKIMSLMDQNISLCDSDKYSFIFAFQTVLPSLPEKMREAFFEGGAFLGDGFLDHREETMQSATFIRRMYLQDLYRFFRLNPQIKMTNIFDNRAWLDYLLKRRILSDRCLSELCKYLLRKKYLKEARLCAESIKSSDTEKSILLAYLSMENGDIKTAYAYFEQAYKEKREDLAVLKGLSKTAFLMSDYQKSHELFSQLASLYPDNLSYKINSLNSGVLSGKAEELLNEVYRLDFEHENHPKTKRLLAWTLLCLGRLDQAENIYHRIIDGDYDEPTENDCICLIDLYWLKHEHKKCTDYIRRYLQLYLNGKTEPQIHDQLTQKMEQESLTLSKYHPTFHHNLSLLLDSVFFENL